MKSERGGSAAGTKRKQIENGAGTKREFCVWYIFSYGFEGTHDSHVESRNIQSIKEINNFTVPPLVISPHVAALRLGASDIYYFVAPFTFISANTTLLNSPVTST